jgi:hypothetical protein
VNGKTRTKRIDLAVGVAIHRRTQP